MWPRLGKRDGGKAEQERLQALLLRRGFSVQVQETEAVFQLQVADTMGRVVQVVGASTGEVVLTASVLLTPEEVGRVKRLPVEVQLSLQRRLRCTLLLAGLGISNVRAPFEQAIMVERYLDEDEVRSEVRLLRALQYLRGIVLVIIELLAEVLLLEAGGGLGGLSGPEQRRRLQEWDDLIERQGE